MEEVASSANLNQAYKRVKANKGAAGVDGMTVDDLEAWIAVNRDGLIASLHRGTYIALEKMIAEVNSFTTGWVTYFRHAACKGALAGLDEWLRRKLRCVRLKQCKRPKAIAAFLIGCGVPRRRIRLLAGTGKGWWRRSGTPPANEAMTLQWFAAQGLVSLEAHYAALQPAGNRRVR